MWYYYFLLGSEYFLRWYWQLTITFKLILKHYAPIKNLRTVSHCYALVLGWVMQNCPWHGSHYPMLSVHSVCSINWRRIIVIEMLSVFVVTENITMLVDVSITITLVKLNRIMDQSNAKAHADKTISFVLILSWSLSTYDVTPLSTHLQ